MKSNPMIVLVLSLLVFPLLLGLNACSVNVPLDASLYRTGIPAEKFSQYRGKQVYLGSFTNKAENTSIFHYYDRDKDVSYGGPLLTSLFWYCFSSAFLDIGIGVYEHQSPPGVPQMSFTFFSLDDTGIKFNVTLKKDSFQIFKKDYSLDMEKQESKDPKILEERAYRFIDLIIAAILEDSDFKKAFFKSS